MRWGLLAGLLVAAVATAALSFVAWRRTTKWLGVRRPYASGASDHEKRVRRSLRALLAFLFGVIYPTMFFMAVTAIIMAVVERSPPTLLIGAMALALAAVFSIPLPSLAAAAQAMERQRLSGNEPEEVPSFWIDGRLRPLEPDAPFWMRAGRYALLAGAVALWLMEWRLLSALLAYFLVGLLIRAVWNRLAARTRS